MLPLEKVNGKFIVLEIIATISCEKEFYREITFKKFGNTVLLNFVLIFKNSNLSNSGSHYDVHHNLCNSYL